MSEEKTFTREQVRTFFKDSVRYIVEKSDDIFPTTNSSSSVPMSLVIVMVMAMAESAILDLLDEKDPLETIRANRVLQQLRTSRPSL